VSRKWSRAELGLQLRNEILGYRGAAGEFEGGLAKELKLSRTDMRCLDLIGRLGPLTAGRLAEEASVTTGAVTFILDRLEEAGMVTRRRDTEDRRRIWVEIVPEAQRRMLELQQPVADEMRQVSMGFAPEQLAIVRDYMRQAKEVFQRQIGIGFPGETSGEKGTPPPVTPAAPDASPASPEIPPSTGTKSGGK
jgi:DNA-binding MarR family transcriptional regulator